MGRSYQAEQVIQDYFDGLLSRKAGVQVGLIVGKQAVGARDVLLHVVRTPLKGDTEAVQVSVGSASAAGSSRSGKKAGGSAPSGAAAATSVSVDVEWVAQHAGQVARMLPGGVCLIGCYLFSSDAGYQSAVPQLCSILAALRQLLPPSAGQELVVVHADAGTRKVTARSSSSGTGSAQLSPAELKWAPCLPQLMTISCRWPLDCALPTPDAAPSLLQQLQHISEQASAAIRSSIGCLPAGSVPAPDALMMDVSPSSAAGSLAGLPHCTLQLLPLQGLAADEFSSSSADHSSDATASRQGGGGQQGEVRMVCGCGHVRGWLYGCAVVHKRQSWASAVQELKDDLCSSLGTRVELQEEDALSWQEEQAGAAAGAAAKPAVHPLLDGGSLGRPYTAALAHRALIPAVLGGLPAFDHLLPGEGPSEAAARAAELLGPLGAMDVAQLEEQVTLVENEGSLNTKLAAWNPLSPPAAAVEGTQEGSSKTQRGPQCSSMVLGGAAAGVAAVVAGLAMYMMGMTMHGP